MSSKKFGGVTFFECEKYQPFQYVGDIFKCSLIVEKESKDPRSVFYQNNGVIAIVDESGRKWVTPYRPEIHGILEAEGYAEYGISVPKTFKKAKDIAKFTMLKKMADRQCNAYEHEKAHEFALHRGIKPVSIPQKCKITEATKSLKYHTAEDEITFVYPSMSKRAMNTYEAEDIGTFVKINDKLLVVCDDYGRTYVIETGASNDPTINCLYEAGYTENFHPWSMIFTRKISECGSTALPGKGVALGAEFATGNTVKQEEEFNKGLDKAICESLLKGVPEKEGEPFDDECESGLEGDGEDIAP